MARIDFTDAHVLVTGGSSGIGRAFVRKMVDRQARVSVIALPDDDLAELEDELADRHATFITAGVDVTDHRALADAIGGLTAQSGPCDVLLTCAGIAHPGRFTELDDSVFRRTMEVDYFGTLHAMRAAVPAMIERCSGSVVGISSAAGLVGIYGYTPYAPAKFAVRGLLEALRCELAPYGIHVGCVCPPDTDTPQLAYENRYKPRETSAISGQIRPLSAERVADAIIRGIERRQFLIAPDWQTRLLARTVGLVPEIYRASFDRRVRAARPTSGRVRAWRRAGLPRAPRTTR